MNMNGVRWGSKGCVGPMDVHTTACKSLFAVNESPVIMLSLLEDLLLPQI